VFSTADIVVEDVSVLSRQLEAKGYAREKARVGEGVWRLVSEERHRSKDRLMDAHWNRHAEAAG
jgi:hypothetical protein